MPGSATDFKEFVAIPHKAQQYPRPVKKEREGKKNTRIKNG
jgi:hypothetical protein